MVIVFFVFHVSRLFGDKFFEFRVWRFEETELSRFIRR